MLPDVDRRAINGLKFSAVLPERLAVATIAVRLADFEGAYAALTEPVRLRSHGDLRTTGHYLDRRRSFGLC
ncbi:hypothetical protein AB0L65_16495 [Nonomuraea sp. NPDC052116]|uniref:hypothetical protein n=1 Tax=Nonomuraea sp. NPDC052116 TaxID=3155665 RepID=UPI003437C758